MFLSTGSACDACKTLDVVLYLIKKSGFSGNVVPYVVYCCFFVGDLTLTTDVACPFFLSLSQATPHWCHGGLHLFMGVSKTCQAMRLPFPHST